MSTMDSPGGESGRCVRLTTYHPCSAERQEIRGLNLPGIPVSLLGLSVGVTYVYARCVVQCYTAHCVMEVVTLWS
jgi:hypothetical protein